MVKEIFQESRVSYGSLRITEEFRSLLRERAFIQSMRRRGNCYDNEVTERFFHTLKTELVKRSIYQSRE